jgi:hypothetical protein
VTARTEDYVAAATRRFRDRLRSVIAEHERSGSGPDTVLGDPADFADRAIEAAATIPSPWDEIAGPFVRSEGVQARLGISRQAVAAKAARRRLLRVVTSDGVHLYPLWQFDGRSVLAGLADVIALFPEAAVDGWTLAGWLRTTDPDLGASPYDVLVHGEAERVLGVARGAALDLAS